MRIPVSPANRSGWPWHVPEPRQTWGGPGPRLSIVIPSYNQGEFIEETLRSILLQGYPHLELLVIDGGSSDNTLAVIEKYRAFIDYAVSEPDRGQAHAINKGFARATGDLVAWCNADDYYYPFAFFALAQAYLADPTADVYYGDKERVDADGRFLSPAPALAPTQENMIPWLCIHSEVSFFQRRLFHEERYRLNEERRHYMDYDLFWELILEQRRFCHVPAVRAAWRQHPAAKSSRQGDIAQQEEFDIYCRVYRHDRLAQAVRPKLQEAIRNSIRTDWANNRYTWLRAHVRRMIEVCGRQSLRPDILLKYLLSHFPPPVLSRFKESLRKIMRRLCLS